MKERDAVYKLYLDLTKTVKDGLRKTSNDELQDLIAAALNLMTPPEETEEVTLPKESLQQLAVFAAQAVSRQLYERYKKS